MRIMWLTHPASLHCQNGPAKRFQRDNAGRDYLTVSRQTAKLASLGLIVRRESSTDRRVREAEIALLGKAMTDLIDAAHDRMLRAGFANWEKLEVDTLVTLMRNSPTLSSPAGSFPRRRSPA